MVERGILKPGTPNVEECQEFDGLVKINYLAVPLIPTHQDNTAVTGDNMDLIFMMKESESTITEATKNVVSMQLFMR
jgi:hypothetical protein